MTLSETIITTDDSVSTEDRFALRKFIEEYTSEINKNDWGVFSENVDKSFTANGFADYPLFKKQFKKRILSLVQNPNSFIRIPKLHARYGQFMFVLKGTYEEYGDGVLNTEGNLELFIAKLGDNYKIIKMHFYPRMLLKDTDE